SPQTYCLYFPACALQFISACARLALIPSLRCAKLGVASVDAASATASAVRSVLILIMVGSYSFLLYLSCANHLSDAPRVRPDRVNPKAAPSRGRNGPQSQWKTPESGPPFHEPAGSGKTARRREPALLQGRLAQVYGTRRRGNLTKWSCGGGNASGRDRRKICWCRRADSNRQPIAYEAIALPLSYCGVQKGPSTKLLSNKPPPRTRCVPLPLVGRG